MWLNRFLNIGNKGVTQPKQTFGMTLNKKLHLDKQKQYSIQKQGQNSFKGLEEEKQNKDQQQKLQSNSIFEYEEQAQESNVDKLAELQASTSTTLRKSIGQRVGSYVQNIKNTQQSIRKSRIQQLVQKRQSFKQKRLKLATASKQALEHNSIAFSFSAGGYLFPYYVGVIFELEDLKIIKKGTPLCGSSAGSLIAACYNAGLTRKELIGAVNELTLVLREIGSFSNLSEELYKILSKYMPQDGHINCSGNTFLGVTRIRPNYQPMIVSQFESREDLIRTLMTSCHIPVWSDKTYTTRYRDGHYMDGGFAQFIPVPEVEHIEHTVRISCYPLQTFNKREVITEISPDLYRRVPLSIRQITRMSFQPGSDEEIEKLVSMGKENAQMWAKLVGIDITTGQSNPDDISNRNNAMISRSGSEQTDENGTFSGSEDSLESEYSQDSEVSQDSEASQDSGASQTQK